MKNDKKDLRVIKTQNLLFKTFLELLKDYPFEKIKVSDICNKAKINRSTFYSHYNDKYELMIDFMTNLKDSLVSELDKNNYSYISNIREYYMEMIRLLFNHLEENKNVYQLVLINNENSIIVDMIYNTISSDLANNIKNSSVKSEVPLDVLSRYYIGAIVAVGASWLKGSIKCSKKEILNYFDKLIPKEI